MRGRNWLIVMLVVPAVLAAACAEDPAPAGQAVPQSTTTIVTTLETTTTTTAPVMVAPTDPAELAEFLQLRLEDFPTGYEIDTELDHDELCEGVSGVTVQFPPVAETSADLEGDHIASTSIAVYDSAEAAIEAFEYLEASYRECDGSVTVQDDATEVFLQIERFTAPSIEGTDRLGGYHVVFSSEAFSVLFDTNIGVEDKVLFSTASTDLDIVTDLSRTVIARSAGDDAAVEIVPTGSIEILPGYSSPEYYSWPEGPAEIRALEFEGESKDWVEAASDVRIDEVAGNSCVVANELEPGDDVVALDTAILSVFSPDEIAQYPAEALGEVFGAGVALYCPGLFTHLQDVAAAAS